MNVKSKRIHRPERGPEPKPSRKMTIVRDYDLRTPLKYKASDAKKHMGWVVFHNTKGTLAHVMFSGDEDSYWRIVTRPLKDSSDTFIYHYFITRLITRLCI